MPLDATYIISLWRRSAVTVYHGEEGLFWEGIFIQARVVGGGNTSFGTFGTNGDVELSPLSCGTGVNV